VWTSQGYLLHEVARALNIRTGDIGVRVRTLYARMRFERPRMSPRRVRRAA